MQIGDLDGLKMQFSQEMARGIIKAHKSGKRARPEFRAITISQPAAFRIAIFPIWNFVPSTVFSRETADETNLFCVLDNWQHLQKVSSYHARFDVNDAKHISTSFSLSLYTRQVPGFAIC